MTAKTKLELTWIGKENRPRLEPRILIEDVEFSHHCAKRREGDIFSNVLIKGDNLLALKALEAEYLGQIKCIFIDPPIILEPPSSITTMALSTLFGCP